MILRFRCPNGHERDVPNVTTPQEIALIKACVRARLARCDTCEEKIARVEEVQEPS